MAFDPVKLAEDTEAFCQEVRPAEELAYAERKFNDQVVPLAKKHDLLGMNVHPEYGGRGADAVSYFKALARIGREGTTVRTFFSGHLSIGAYPIQTWGSDALKKKYLPAAARGDKILAFGLTEPDAGSNPREMTTTFEKKGDGYVLNGVKYLISNGGIADAVVAFGYPAGAVGTGRISAFVVDTDAKGFEAESFAANAKMGMPTSNTAMFEMHDVIVPLENLLGSEGRRLPRRDGHAGERPVERRGGVSGRDRRLSRGSHRVREDAEAARQGDRTAPTRAGPHRAHRNGPRRERRAADARGRDEGPFRGKRR